MEYRNWFFLAILLAGEIFAQEPVEQVGTLVEPEETTTFLLDWEQWEIWKKDPLPLHSATLEELVLLPGVDALMAHQLIEYRAHTRSIQTPFELAQLRSWDRSSVEAIIPYVQFGTHQSAGPFALYGYWHHEVLIRSKSSNTPAVEVQDGTAPGDNTFGYLRYIGNKGTRLRWGWALEKDHGEPVRASGKWIVHRAGFIRWKNGLGPIGEWTLGSFRLSWGQGLIVNDGYRGVGGPQLRIDPPVRVAGHASSSESNYQNGVIVRGHWRALQYGMWMSRTGRSIRIDTVQGIWSTAYTDGLFRTGSRIHWWQSAREDRQGAYVLVKQLKWTAGILSEQRRWDTRQEFTGIPQLNKEILSGIFRWRGGSAMLFGEAAILRERLCWEVQTFWVPDDQWKLRIRFRSVPEIPQGNLPRFYFPIRPQGEREMWIENWWNPLPYVHTYLTVRRRSDQQRWGGRMLFGRLEELQVQADLQVDQGEHRKQWRIQARRKWGRWQGTLRGQWSRDLTGGGALSFLDLQCTLKEHWKLYGRWTIYRTDDFRNRLYTYENDVLYAFSVPAFYGAGQKAYLMVKYGHEVHQWWCKVSVDKIVGWTLQYRMSL